MDNGRVDGRVLARLQTAGVVDGAEAREFALVEDGADVNNGAEESENDRAEDGAEVSENDGSEDEAEERMNGGAEESESDEAEEIENDGAEDGGEENENDGAEDREENDGENIVSLLLQNWRWRVLALVLLSIMLFSVFLVCHTYYCEHHPSEERDFSDGMYLRAKIKR